MKKNLIISGILVAITAVGFNFVSIDSIPEDVKVIGFVIDSTQTEQVVEVVKKFGDRPNLIAYTQRSLDILLAIKNRGNALEFANGTDREVMKDRLEKMIKEISNEKYLVVEIYE